MLSTSFSNLILYIAAYSILGWICEVIYCSVPSKRFINRGFLYGPYCPMYGIGAVLILTITEPFTQYPLLVFLVSLCVVTLLEYFTGWLMESLFQVRFWDYSNKKFNIKGRICLKNSLIFGIMGLVTTYFMHPFVTKLIDYIPKDYLRVFASLIIVVFFIDLFHTLSTMLKFTERLKTLKNYLEEIEQYNKEYAWFDRNDLTGSISRLKDICQNDTDNENLANILSRLENMVEKTKWRFRFIKSFPNMKPRGFDTAIDDLRKVWKQRKEQFEEQKESFQQRIWNATKRFGRKTTTVRKEARASFASGLGFYKIFWVFTAASVLGYAVETVFCFVTTGTIESRQGLIYGPFCQVYGIGAVLMVLILTPLAKKNDRWVFFGSAVVGGTFEYLCSWAQELIFGSVSWEYSDLPFSIGGRTSLTYMLFWGILGIWFIKGIYPALSSLIERIPNRQGLFFTWILIIILSVDIFLSASAVYRWSERQDNIPPSNAYEEFLDKQYPNATLEKIYPHMTWR